VLCAAASGPDPGHSNWFPATYRGRLYWESHSCSWGCDDDYSLNLYTEGRGSLQGNGRGEIHIEFDSDETIDHFRTSWWSGFHEAVDESDREAYIRVQHKTAIVTGLMGIDWAHTPSTELHPVWAMAIRVSETLQPQSHVSTSEWAFFVRNWGNEGFCSSQDHQLDDLRTYTFQLDWEPGAINGQLLSYDIRTGWFFFGSLPDASVTITFARGVGVFVTFRLPPPSLEPFYEGSIQLKWTYDASGPTPPPPVPARLCSIEPGGCDEQDAPEKTAAALLGPLLSESQKAAIAAKLKRPNIPSEPLSPNAISVRYESQPPVPPKHRPKTLDIFDKQHAQRDRLQRSLLCNALGGTIPSFPAGCFTPATLLNFDDQPVGTKISDQYAARGVTFGPTASTEASAPQIAQVGAQANSGVNVLRLAKCFLPSCEFERRSFLNGTFAVPQQGLGMFVGEFSPTRSATTVTLEAYDANNRLVGQTQATLAPGHGFHTPLILESSSANITRFVVSAPNEIGIDDFALGVLADRQHLEHGSASNVHTSRRSPRDPSR
jgi:hypothetical protein